jgi:hypothetical protein
MTNIPTISAIAVIVFAPFIARGQEAPDALSVEWQGKKVCEKLHEDEQIRILRCSFPPGVKNVRDRHPATFVYTLGGGKAEFTDASGTRRLDMANDAYLFNQPIPWHDITNAGDTTLRYVLVELKYQK